MMASSLVELRSFTPPYVSPARRVRGLLLSIINMALPGNSATTLISSAHAGPHRSTSPVRTRVIFAAFMRMKTLYATCCDIPSLAYRRPGYFATYLESADIPWRLVALDEGEAVPLRAGYFS